MSNQDQKPTTYLVSYPRSSNTWTRYVIEWITSKPTGGIIENPKDIPICQEDVKFLSHVDQKSNFIVRKIHCERAFVRKKHPIEDRMILITRDPATVIKKHGEGRIRRKEIRNYLKLLDIFEKWQGEKIHLTFEENIKNEPIFTKKIINFIDNSITQERIDEFLDKIDSYRSDCKSYYSNSASDYKKKSKNVQVNLFDRFLVKAYFILRGKNRLLKMTKFHG